MRLSGRAPEAAPRPAPSGRIESIAKNHNQHLGGVGPALRLDVQFKTENLRGRELYLVAWFVRTDTGESIAPVMDEYADGEGRLTAQTQAVRVQVDRGSYSANLWVPYGAFPAPEAEDAYGVEVRVLLVARGSDGTDVVLSRSETSFTVHGS